MGQTETGVKNSLSDVGVRWIPPGDMIWLVLEFARKVISLRLLVYGKG
jgi:hypothetical protein